MSIDNSPIAIHLRGMKTPLDSPALRSRSAAYPLRFEDRVPKRIRMIETVFPEPLNDERFVHIYAYRGWVYDAFVSSAGDVAAVVSGRLLALKPHQFEVTEWH